MEQILRYHMDHIYSLEMLDLMLIMDNPDIFLYSIYVPISVSMFHQIRILFNLMLKRKKKMWDLLGIISVMFWWCFFRGLR